MKMKMSVPALCIAKDYPTLSFSEKLGGFLQHRPVSASKHNTAPLKLPFHTSVPQNFHRFRFFNDPNQGNFKDACTNTDFDASHSWKRNQITPDLVLLVCLLRRCYSLQVVQMFNFLEPVVTRKEYTHRIMLCTQDLHFSLFDDLQNPRAAHGRP